MRPLNVEKQSNATFMLTAMSSRFAAWMMNRLPSARIMNRMGDARRKIVQFSSTSTL